MKIIAFIAMPISAICFLLGAVTPHTSPLHDVLGVIGVPFGIMLLGAIVGAIFGPRRRRVDVYHHRDPRR